MSSKKQPAPESAAVATDAPKPRKPRAKKAKLELVEGDAPRPEATPFNPTITMTWEGEPEPCWTGPLDEIAQANADDGLDQGEEWIAEVRGALQERGEYTGGGGAAPEYVLRVVEEFAGKPKRAKRTKRAQAAQEPDAAEPAAEPATEPAAQEPPAEAPKRGRGRKSKTTATAPDSTPAKGQRDTHRIRRVSKADAMTLAQLAEKFLAALEADGRSDSTLGAYKADLAIAQRVLGADTAIDGIRLPDVIRFNGSDAVILARTGQPKAGPTIERTRRVLRLAFEFAEAEGFVVTTPCVEPGDEPEA